MQRYSALLPAKGPLSTVLAGAEITMKDFPKKEGFPLLSGKWNEFYLANIYKKDLTCLLKTKKKLQTGGKEWSVGGVGWSLLRKSLFSLLLVVIQQQRWPYEKVPFSSTLSSSPCCTSIVQTQYHKKNYRRQPTHNASNRARKKRPASCPGLCTISEWLVLCRRTYRSLGTMFFVTLLSCIHLLDVPQGTGSWNSCRKVFPMP